MTKAQEVLSLLVGHVWHATHPSRAANILRSGHISPAPPVPDSFRWGTRLGPQGYPFCRSIGAVSLFDLRKFDPELYEDAYPISTWRTFVPTRPDWHLTAWMEIDRDSALNAFVDPAEVLERWRESKEFCRNIMPMIEAAHLGSIPVKCVRRILLCGAAGTVRVFPGPFSSQNSAKEFIKFYRMHLKKTHHSMNEYHLEFLRNLNQNAVKYLVIGGQAKAIYYESPTRDLDIWAQTGEDAGRNLAAALKKWAAKYPAHTGVAWESVTSIGDKTQIKFPDAVGCYLNSEGSLQDIQPSEGVDVLTSLGQLDFKEHHERATKLVLSGVPLRVLNKKDLSRTHRLRPWPTGAIADPAT